jgi:Fur family ferric uptake transcriptional regulator
LSCTRTLEDNLRGQGLRMTPQRAVILETVAHARSASTVQAVYERARRRLPGLNRATVYRTLESLRQAGVLDLHAKDGKGTTFLLHDASRPHIHLVCRRCGREQQVDAAWTEDLADRLRRQTGFRLDAEHLLLDGVCRRCGSDRAGRP